MRTPEQHRRRIKHFHESGDLDELTFSCYRRLPLLTNDAWRELLARAVDCALRGRQFALVAFVFMPEHVHLLVYPRSASPQPEDVERFLKAVKRPFSYRIKQILATGRSRLLGKLTVADRRRGGVFRFWQKGPGYDRNLSSEAAVLASIDYIHTNPVARGLVRQAAQWRWSSARWYTTERREVDRDLPRIDGLPAEFF